MGKLDGKKLKQVIDPTHAKVFTHPLRGHVWVTLFERGVVSPTEVANELELEPSDVSYHFRELNRKDLIRLVRTEQRRGFDEHFYAPVAPAVKFDDEMWMQIPEQIRSTFSGETLKQLTDSLAEALEAGSFDARNRHLSRTWLRLDERGWKELTRLLRRTLDRVQAIQESSAERCDEQSAEAICVEMAMVAFETVASMAGREAGETDEL
jgi:hypothetical protein